MIDDVYYFDVYKDTTMNKRDLERHLRVEGLSHKRAKIIASKCGQKIILPKKNLWQRLFAWIIKNYKACVITTKR